ncbi:MAG: thioredoxin domain-containing protein, partial [Bdellovibrionales bacterium]|nr:thioredoxin domain-containing protein [Bdellovibrionales bacterium]
MKNHLSQEVSPYLLQHQSNPVWWYPWGNEAFEQARVRERPVFLSIGYSTCYWCHVMEKECFEDLDVASFLNEHFVSIKVDREEQPAVDQYYMDAVLGMTGHGGWPMSVMLTAERQPFWGGTYFPKLQFLNVLQQIHTAWISNRQKIYEISQKIGASLASLSTVDPGEGGEGRINEREEEAYTILKRAYDAEDGGFGRAPKFPPTQQIRFLLRRGANSDQAEAKQMALFTLERMACGGIYDQIGGGFSRYSVDEHWLVPHFEKMLYDNSLLLEAYVEAAQATGELFFEEVVGETADYLLRDMRSPEGGFFAAEDAGEVGREGEFYVFSYAELRAKLSAEEFTHLESLCFL